MSRRRPDSDVSGPEIAAPAESPAPGASADLLRNGALGLLAALYIATPLIPSESAATFGTGVVLVMLWLILAAIWLVEGMIRGRLEIRCGWTGTALVGLIFWQIVSTFVMSSEGTPRLAINVAWEWIAMGLGFLLVRSLVRTEKEVRAFLAVMVGLAICLSLFTFYEVLYSIPQRQAAYRDNPEAVMRDAGVYAEPGTPVWEQFKSRIGSQEPSATFALTNSLAGFLAPWLTIGVGLLLIAWHEPRLPKSILAGAGLALLIILFSLLLTKSRTGYIAAAIGGGLVWMYGRSNLSRSMWMAPLLAGGLVILLGFAAALSGGIDAEVLSEAPKSISYRLQYWQSTMQMVNDHPLYGVGPGNFQEYYTTYQLPEASETVSDPHNFLLEVWATAGSPAVFALVVALGCFLWETSRASMLKEADSFLGPFGFGGTRETEPEPDDEEEAAAKRKRRREEPHSSGPPGHWFIFGGALFGACMSLPLRFLIGYGFEPADLFAFLIVCVPLAALCVYLLYPWIERGELPIAVPMIAVLVILVDFLAAGGITLPGVAGSLWLLIALTLQWAEREKPPAAAPAPVALAGLAIVFLLGFACYQTSYEPVLVGGSLLDDGQSHLARGNFAQAEQKFQAAAKSDPYTPTPHRGLAELYFARWQSSPASLRSDETFASFEKEMREAVRLASHSAELRRQVGNWYLTAYRDTGKPDYLEKAVAAHRKAVELFPASSEIRAQLAWTLHVAGDRLAANEAAEALRLNDVNKHQERDLAKLKVHDPGPTVTYPRTKMPPGPDRNAAELMKMLR